MMEQPKLIPCGACEMPISVQASSCPDCRHPNEQIAIEWFSKGKWLVTTLLAIIGLSGLADGFVEWREFFEVGFMGYYRAFKITILTWLNLWWWVPDYLILGSAMSRATYNQLKALDEYFSLKREVSTKEKMCMVFMSIGMIPIWWVWFFHNLTEYLAPRYEEQDKIAGGFIGDVMKTLASFIIVVFVATDFYKTLQ